MLLAGFAIAAVSTGLMGFMGPSTLAAWAAVLFATRVGAAMVEVMSENYFFKSRARRQPGSIGFLPEHLARFLRHRARFIAVPVLFFIPALQLPVSRARSDPARGILHKPPPEGT